MTKQRFTTVLVEDDDTSGCGIELPFNPKEVFGRVRAPVRVTIRRFTFRTTTFSMGGCYWIPVNKENRRGAGIAAGDSFTVTMELDSEPRIITPPPDLQKALRANQRAHAAWRDLSYTHRKEHVRAVEGAKKPETRQRRIRKVIDELAR